MITSKNGKRVRELVRAWRARGETVGFVPTMGNLHEGHLSLVRRARSRCDRTVVSIFVNPTQFGPQEDYRSYPRTLSRDLRLCREVGVECCFTPSEREMYAPGELTEVRIPELEGVLEGRTRPTHFTGVLRVVLKLLHIVEPDELILGQKDAQQALILETMVRDLKMGVRVVRGKIVREPGGLALSSRNAYLSDRQREAAGALYRGLRAARKAALSGERRASALRRIVTREIGREPLLRVDYVACVDAATLKPLRSVRGAVLLAAAVYAGTTRLIDNQQFTVKGSS